jgi:hypothetical protein
MSMFTATSTVFQSTPHSTEETSLYICSTAALRFQSTP